MERPMFWGYWFKVVFAVIFLHRTCLAENLYKDYGYIFTGSSLQNGVQNGVQNGQRDMATMNVTAEEVKAANRTYTEDDFIGLQLSDTSAFYVACQADYDSNRLFLYDYTQRRLVQLDNFNTSLIEKSMPMKNIYHGNSKEFGKLAIDWISGNLYWTDPLSQRIVMVSIANPADDKNSIVVINTDLAFPTGIAVDPLAGYLFWADYGDRSYQSRIERSSLLGEDRMTLVHLDVRQPDALFADPATGRLYWTNFYRIESVLYSGFDRKTLKQNYNAYYIDLALVGNSFAALDYYATDIVFIDKVTGQSTIPNIAYTTEVFYATCSYQADVQPRSPQGKLCATAECDQLCVQERDVATCVCRSGFKKAGDGSCIEAAGKFIVAIVVNNGTHLCFLNILFVTNAHNYTETVQCFYKHNLTGETIQFMAIDMSTRTVYFSTERAIWKVTAHVDANDATRLVLLPDGSSIRGLTFDWVGRNLYWTEHSGRTVTIYPVDRPGDSITVDSGGNSTVREIIVLPHARKVLYVTDVRDFWSADLDFLEKALLSPTTFSPSFPAHLSLDSLEERVYFVDGTRLYRSSLTTPTTPTWTFSLIDDIAGLNNIALYKEYLMLFRLSATNETELITVDSERLPLRAKNTGLIKGLGIVISILPLDADIQPQYPDPCISAGCDQICLRLANTFECDCSRGYELASDRKSCLSDPVTDNFMLVADISNYNIYQISLNGPSTLNAIPDGGTGRPTYASYESDTQKVTWTDARSVAVWSGTLDGRDIRALIDVDAATPQRLVREPNTGNVYYTAVSWYADFFYDSFIGVFSPSGRHKTLVKNAGHKPNGIALDSRAGLLFWTDSGSSSYRGIKRCRLNGTMVTSLDIDATKIYRPNDITIDFNAYPTASLPEDKGRIYWTDGYFDKIFSSKYDGSDLQELLQDAGTSLMGIHFYDTLVYYTSLNIPYVKYTNRDNTVNGSYGQGLSLGVLNSVEVYKSSVSAEPAHPVCSGNQGRGPCSDFCFPTGLDSYSCGCPDDVALLADNKTCSNRQRCQNIITNGTILNIELSDPQQTNPCLRINGSVCAYNCDLGFKPTVASLTCMDGEWSPKSPCQQIRCPTTIPNGDLSFNCQGNVFEDCTAYTCNDGYEKLKGLSSLKCKLTGNWSEDLTQLCQEKCPKESAVLNGELNANCPRDPGSVCMFTCNERYQYASDVRGIMCKPGSMWNATVSLCEEILCTRNIPNGRLSDRCQARIDDDCRDFTCNINYERAPNITELICNINGNWSVDILDLCEEKCPAGSIGNAVLDQTCSRYPGENCRFTCSQGTKYASGLRQVRCNPGPSWGVTTDLCEVKCPDDPIENGLLASSCMRSPGTTCTFTCDTGYTYTQHDVTGIDCRSDSTWNVTSGHCRVITCPKSIVSGRIDKKCQFKYNEQCDYTCDSGYRGNINFPNIRCVGDGTWSHVTTTQAICAVIPPKKGLSTAVVAGISAGAALFVILLIVILIVCLCCCRKRKRASSAKDAKSEISPTYFENPHYENRGAENQPGAENVENEFYLGNSRNDQSFKGLAFTTLHEDQIRPEPESSRRGRSSMHSEHVYDNPTYSVTSGKSKMSKSAKRPADSRFSKR